MNRHVASAAERAQHGSELAQTGRSHEEAVPDRTRRQTREAVLV
jgi:hypothetical protein